MPIEKLLRQNLGMKSFKLRTRYRWKTCDMTAMLEGNFPKVRTEVYEPFLERSVFLEEDEDEDEGEDEEEDGEDE